MTTQPEALRLADELEVTNGLFIKHPAASELRRLHLLTQEWECKAATWLASPEAAQRLEGYRELAQRVNALETLNQELLLALKRIGGRCDVEPAYKIARAAIAKATGEQK